jgi:hypothetical protein
MHTPKSSAPIDLKSGLSELADYVTTQIPISIFKVAYRVKKFALVWMPVSEFPILAVLFLPR